MANAAVEPALADENDDSWLYGDSNVEQTEEKENDIAEKEPEQTEADNAGEDEDEKEQENDTVNDDDEHFEDVGRDAANGDADSQDNADSDSDDSDDVKVTIGEIKSVPQSYAIKRGVGLVASGAADKPRVTTATAGKVVLDDLEGPGSINGVPALEFNIDTIEDKPWNKPGADISDYFNYGFTEVTWSAYCERQRRMRVNESGVGLHSVPLQRPLQSEMRQRPQGTMMRDESMPQSQHNNYQHQHENTIQVMTGDRREYGRPRDGDYFPAHAHAPTPHDAYYAGPPPHAGYDEHWGRTEPNWVPNEIKELTPGPMVSAPLGPPPPAAHHLPPPHGPPPAHHPAPAGPPPPPHHHLPPPPHHHLHPPAPAYRPHDRERMRDDRDRDRRDRDRDRDRDRREDEDRDRERDRSRSIKPDRGREKSYRRERSRSRSRRHKSRSRSPRPRDRSRDRERDRERSVKPKSKESSQKDKDEDK